MLWSVVVFKDIEQRHSLFDFVLQVLHGILTMPGDKGFAENVRSLLATYQADLAADPLLSCLTEACTLRPFLDVVLENTLTFKLNVCEVQAGESSVYRHIVKQLADQPKLHVKVTAADTDLLQGEDFEALNVTPKEWDFSKETAAELGKFHLVVLNNVLHRQPKVVDALHKAAELTEDGGFLLVQEVTHNFPVYLAMEALHKDVPLQASENGSAYGRYHSESAWKELFAAAGLEVVMQVSDNCLSSLFLLRRKVTEVGEVLSTYACHIRLKQLLRGIIVQHNKMIDIGAGWGL